MIIELNKDISERASATVLQKLSTLGFEVTKVTTQHQQCVVALGRSDVDVTPVAKLEGVTNICLVNDGFQLVSRRWKKRSTLVSVGNSLALGGGGCEIIAGPCSIESAEQIAKVQDFLVAEKVFGMRGGVFKPRTSPYAFRGQGLDALRMTSELVRSRGLSLVTEVLDASQVEPMLPFTDMFQVGARNSQNFSLLCELGKVDKPVLLKRGMSGTIDELLQSAEYVFSAGNEKIVLCERGIRTFEHSYRNTFDINAIPILKEKTHLPVVADPSHGVGIRRFVAPVALAAVMAGADAVMVEIHPEPQNAKSDGDQTLDFSEARELFSAIRSTANLRQELFSR